MIIRVNGEEHVVGEHTTIYDFVVNKGRRPEKVVVEHNLEIIPRELWKEIVLKEEDQLEVISFVGGG